VSLLDSLNILGTAQSADLFGVSFMALTKMGGIFLDAAHR
jgi:hypothetical protein